MNQIKLLLISNMGCGICVCHILKPPRILFLGNLNSQDVGKVTCTYIQLTCNSMHMHKYTLKYTIRCII